MNSYWEKKALKRKGIKGEHAYLEAVQDFKKLLDKEIRKLEVDHNDLAVSLDNFKHKYFKRK